MTTPNSLEQARAAMKEYQQADTVNRDDWELGFETGWEHREEVDAKRIEHLTSKLADMIDTSYRQAERVIALESRLTAAESKLKIAREALVEIHNGAFTLITDEISKRCLTALDSEAAAAAGVEK